MWVQITIKEIVDRGLWEKFCRVTGMSFYARNEGMAYPDDVVELDEKQALEIGLLTEQGD